MIDEAIDRSTKSMVTGGIIVPFYLVILTFISAVLGDTCRFDTSLMILKVFVPRKQELCGVSDRPY
jgi:hypothetical protein